MPQVTLLLSNNIELGRLNLKEFFERVHEVLRDAPKMDVHTIHSGVLQESYSYIGINHPTATKVYLQLCWMESPERTAIKAHLGQQLMAVLEKDLAPQIRSQGLLCIPRVRISTLGALNQDYFISAQ